MKLREFALALSLAQAEGNLAPFFTSKDVAHALGMYSSQRDYDHIKSDIARQYHLGNLIRTKNQRKTRSDCVYLYSFSKKGENFVEWVLVRGMDSGDGDARDVQIISDLFKWPENIISDFRSLVNQRVVRISPSQLKKMCA